MDHWIFISSTKRFRMNDFLSDYGFVEFEQKNNVQVNDIVYLYTTAPVKRIEYKMIVEKINIPPAKQFDDSAYSLRKQPQSPVEKCVRLRVLEKTAAPQLHLSMLRQYGVKCSMQSPFRISGKLLEYIDSFFEK